MAFQEVIAAEILSKALNPSDVPVDSKGVRDLLYLILVELRVISYTLTSGLNVIDDVEQIRQDIDTNFNNPLV